MGRALPANPRGSKRERSADRTGILGIPRECPYWQFNAMRALLKPQFKQSIAHRSSTQKLTSGEMRRAAELWEKKRIASRRRVWPELHFPDGGDYLLISTYRPSQAALAKELAVELSKLLTKQWLVVGELLVHQGVLYRRSGLRKLYLRPVTARRPRRSVRTKLIEIYRSLADEPTRRKPRYAQHSDHP